MSQKDEFTAAAHDYIWYYGHLHCRITGKKVSTQCTCLCALVDGESALAAACCLLVEFYSLNKTQRYSLLMHLCLSAISFVLRNNPKVNSGKNIILRGKCFQLALNLVNTNSNKSCMSVFSLCQAGMLVYFGLGIKAFRKLKADVISGKAAPKKHGLSGLQSNNTLAGVVLTSLHEFLDGLQEYAEPHATRVVQLHCGVRLDDDDGCVLLPSHWGVRHLYGRWCYECGWIGKGDGSGNLGCIADYAPRPNDDIDWPSYSVSLEVCSLSSFRSYWRKYFPLMKVKTPTLDSCVVCWQYCCAFSSIQRHLKTIGDAHNLCNYNIIIQLGV